ncbi:MAG: AMP-binding protein [Desulfobacterales bacterium]|jgi:long-chain acyl-CoA synthetase|nr:AMP-binding protein [Desulfobacterales bacterium]
MGLYDFTFYDLINRNAVAFGERFCWIEADDGRQLTFSNYKNQVDCLAGGLYHAGIRKGDRIGLVGKNSLEFFLLYGAAAALGAIMLPVNWRLSADELCFNLNDGAPKLLFADAEFQPMLNEKRSELPSIGAYYNLKADMGDALPFKELLNSLDAAPLTDVADADGFVIIHTAAVAGRPRGALVSHGNFMCADLHFNYYLNLCAEDVHLNLLPLFHVAGVVMAFNAFHAGALNINVGKFDAAAAAQLIRDKRVSLCFDFPPILDSILDAASKERIDLSSFKAVVGLGTAEGMERFQSETGGTYHCMYGQTETACLVTMGRYGDRPGSIGKPISLADVCLVDERDQPVKVGEIGEITVKGPMVFKGYWGLPEDNAYTFRDGRHHTGDLGRFDSDGFLFYAGRKEEKELIKPGGENVYPAEVEKVILQHPAVLKTVVIGVPDPKWKEGIKAVCQLHLGQTLSAAELMRFVADRIASYKKPQYVEFVSELPLKSDGTPDRARIKSLYGQP